MIALINNIIVFSFESVIYHINMMFKRIKYKIVYIYYDYKSKKKF